MRKPRDMSGEQQYRYFVDELRTIKDLIEDREYEEAHYRLGMLSGGVSFSRMSGRAKDTVYVKGEELLKKLPRSFWRKR